MFECQLKHTPASIYCYFRFLFAKNLCIHEISGKLFHLLDLERHLIIFSFNVFQRYGRFAEL